jgi:hypothetical protein
MSFQIVALALDANDNVIERKVVPYPYQTRQEAMATAESIAAKYAGARIATGVRWVAAASACVWLARKS